MIYKHNKRIYPGILSRIYRRILWIIEWFGNWLIDGIQFHFTSLSLKKTKTFKGGKERDLVIIANGPSINHCFAEIISHGNCDYACMNYFPLKSEYFDELKPKFIFAMDAMFFDKDYRNIEKRKDTVLLRKKLENVDWDIILFLRQGCSFELKNKHIKEVRVCLTQIRGVYSKFRGWLFDNGLASPMTATVAAIAIMNGIKMGYKNIYVYGIDQSTHVGIKIDSNNDTIHNYTHFYQESKKNTIDYDIGSIFYDSYRSIIGYRMLEKYALARDCKIYNCTLRGESYVDAFERIEFKDKIES